jgi:ectoine hydroxylase-related dioxygenase (phytanoyl-CoA dioxygenase family)
MLPTLAVDSVQDGGSALREAYQRAGGFIIPQLLPQSDIDAVLNLIAETAELLGPCPVSQGGSLAQRASRCVQSIHAQREGGQGLIYEAVAQTPTLHHVASHPAILRAIHAVLSPHVLLHQRLLVLMSLPEDGWHLGRWHQDHYYNGGPETTCTVYLPLQAVNRDNGGLLLAPGRHREGLFDHDTHEYDVPTKWNTIDPAIVATFDPVQQLELAAGDALFFHGLLPHAAQLNRTDDVRFVINLRYRDMLDSDYRAAGWKIPELTAARQALARKPVTAST